MKRLISLLLSLVMLVGLTACAGGQAAASLHVPDRPIRQQTSRPRKLDLFPSWGATPAPGAPATQAPAAPTATPIPTLAPTAEPTSTPIPTSAPVTITAAAAENVLLEASDEDFSVLVTAVDDRSLDIVLWDNRISDGQATSEWDLYFSLGENYLNTIGFNSDDLMDYYYGRGRHNNIANGYHNYWINEDETEDEEMDIPITRSGNAFTAHIELPDTEKYDVYDIFDLTVSYPTESGRYQWVDFYVDGDVIREVILAADSNEDFELFLSSSYTVNDDSYSRWLNFNITDLRIDDEDSPSIWAVEFHFGDNVIGFYSDDMIDANLAAGVFYAAAGTELDNGWHYYYRSNGQEVQESIDSEIWRYDNFFYGGFDLPDTEKNEVTDFTYAEIFTQDSPSEAMYSVALFESLL